MKCPYFKINNKMLNTKYFYYTNKKKIIYHHTITNCYHNITVSIYIYIQVEPKREIALRADTWLSLISAS